MSKVISYFRAEEIKLIRQKKNARFKVALIYPNSYRIGMSNLGLHTVYDLLNKREDTLCERIFFDPRRKTLRSPESRRTLNAFDILAFSVSYELDYLNILSILHRVGLREEQEKRPVMPLIIAGGIVNSFNSLALAKFCDAVFTGEAEETLTVFMDALSRQFHIDSLAKKRQFLSAFNAGTGIFIPGVSQAAAVRLSFIRDVDRHPVSSKIITPSTEFSRTFLVELSRGCPWRCHFCVTSAVCGSFRPRNIDVLISEIDFGLHYTTRIGLVGAAVSDYPQIEKLVSFLQKKEAQISVSSLRVETVSAALLEGLARSGQKTVTFAPEAGTERLRSLLNKNITDKQILDKVQMAKKSGIQKIKLYFMIGLPQEQNEDIKAIVDLSKTAAAIMPVKVNIGIFIPKPKTPFADQKLDDKKALFSKLKFLKQRFMAERGIFYVGSSVKEAIQETVFAYADENFFFEYLKNKPL